MQLLKRKNQNQNEHQGRGKMSEKNSVASLLESMKIRLMSEVGLTEDRAAASIQMLAAGLQAEFGGERVYIHSASRAESQRQKKQVLKLYREYNWSISKIAADQDISERKVYRIISA